MGVRNVLDSFSFSDADVACIAQTFHELRSHGGVSLTDLEPAAACIKITDKNQRDLIDDKSRLLEGPKQQMISWWAEYVLQHRDHWKGVALAAAWDDELSSVPPVIYVFEVASQNPVMKFVKFTKATLCLCLPAIGTLAIGEALQPHFGGATYKCDGSQYSSSDLAWLDEADIFVMPYMQWIGDDCIMTHARPVSFTDFLFQLPLSVRTGRGKRAGTGAAHDAPHARADARIKAKIKDMFPWLTEKDFKDIVIKVRPDKSDDESDADSDPELEDARLEADIASHIADKREALEMDDPVRGAHFYTKLMCGRFTFDKTKGRPWDGIATLPRAHTTQWRGKFKWPYKKSFATLEHGEHGAKLLAEEWVMKATFFFVLFWDGALELDDFDYDFTTPECQYIPSVQFLDWAATVDVASDTWARITEVNSFQPVV